MTVYYVDPWAGDNANTGLSWGQAWQFLASGVALVAGDEVRYAKSPVKQVNWPNTFNNPSIQLAGVTGYVGIDLPSLITWTAVATDTTAVSYGLKFTGSYTAGQKLGYIAVSNTSDIEGIEWYCKTAGGFPASRPYVKVVMCSDATGDIPIIELTGVCYRTGAVSQLSDSFFRRSGASTSVAMQSLALYAAEDFTVTADATFTIVADPILTPQDSDNYTQPGSALVCEPPLKGYVPPVPSVCAIERYYMSYGYVYALLDKIWQVSFAFTGTVVIDAYPPIPWGEENEQVFTFAGAAGNPITIRGGFDTSTDTQDGYTVLSQGGGNNGKAQGIFPFSSGGDHLAFERMICAQAPILSYEYDAFSISSLSFDHCFLGRPSLEGRYLCVQAASTTFHIDTLLLTYCTVGGVSFVGHWSTGLGQDQVSATSYTLSGSLVLGSMGSRMLLDTFALSGAVGQSSAVVAPYLIWACADDIQATLDDVLLIDSLEINTPIQDTGSAATLLVNNCRPVDGDGATINLKVRRFKTTILGDLDLDLPTYNGDFVITVDCLNNTSLAWREATQPEVVLDGTVNITSARIAEYAFAGLTSLSLDPTYMDVGAYRPGWKLTSIGNATISNMRLSWLTLYQADVYSDLPYKCNEYGVFLNNVVARMYHDGPAGLLHITNTVFDLGDSLPADFLPNAAHTIYVGGYGVPFNAIAKGCTISGNISAVGMTTPSYQGAGTQGLWVGTQGSPHFVAEYYLYLDCTSGAEILGEFTATYDKEGRFLYKNPMCLHGSEPAYLYFQRLNPKASNESFLCVETVGIAQLYVKAGDQITVSCDFLSEPNPPVTDANYDYPNVMLFSLSSVFRHNSTPPCATKSTIPHVTATVTLSVVAGETGIVDVLLYAYEPVTISNITASIT